MAARASHLWSADLAKGDGSVAPAIHTPATITTTTWNQLVFALSSARITAGVLVGALVLDSIFFLVEMRSNRHEDVGGLLAATPRRATCARSRGEKIATNTVASQSTRVAPARAGLADHVYFNPNRGLYFFSSREPAWPSRLHLSVRAIVRCARALLVARCVAAFWLCRRWIRVVLPHRSHSFFFLSFSTKGWRTRCSRASALRRAA